MKRVHGVDYGCSFQWAIVEDVTLGGFSGEREILRVAGDDELKSHFHDFFAGEFTAGEVIEDELPVLGEEAFALSDAVDVALVELEPPIRFELCEG